MDKKQMIGEVIRLHPSLLRDLILEYGAEDDVTAVAGGGSTETSVVAEILGRLPDETVARIYRNTVVTR